MKRPFLILVILLLVSMVSMVMISQVYAQATRIFVDPSSNPYTLQPNRVTTIRPNGGGTYGDWTNSTVVIRPMSEGTNTGWNGRTRTLNPNGAGTYSGWNAWTHLQPRTDGNYTGWLGNPSNSYRDWDDWEDYGGGVYYDSDSSYAYTYYDNKNETSALTRLPTERRGLSITRVKVNIVARNTTAALPKIPAEREGVKIILCTVLNANVSSFTAATDWDGWNRNSPWLNLADYSSNYIYTSVANDGIGNFTFADVPHGITGSTVTLYLRTWQSGGDGSDYMNIYLYNGTKWSTAFTITPDSIAAPGNYKNVAVSSWLDTLVKVNATMMAIEKKQVGTADTIGVDHAYISVSGGPTTFDANVNGRIAVGGWDSWTKVGTTKWLNKEDYPSNYIYTSATTDKIGDFTFDDVPAGITWTPLGSGQGAGVQVRLRTWQSPRVDGDTIKIYVFDGTSWSTAFSLPTVPSGYPEYRDVDVSSFLNTRDKINAAKLAIEKVTSGSADTIFVDYACIRLSGVSTASSSSPTIYLTSSYALYSYEWTTNPVYTGLAWNWTAINELQAGVRSVRGGGTFSGYIRVTQLYVGIQTTAGLYTDWDEYPDPTGPNKGDENYFNATGDVQQQSSALTDTTLPGWGTVKVRVTVVARQTIDEDLTITLVIGGTTFGGTKVTPSTTAYTEYSSEWATNPAGGAWTEAAINNAEAGVRSEKVAGSFTGAICVTQLYVKVIEAGNFALWDDEPWLTPPTYNDGDATYNSAIAAESRSSHLQDFGGWTPAKVQVTIVAKTDLPTDETVRIMLVISGAPSPYYGTTYPLTTDYTSYTDVWTKNPYGNVDWTWTAINAMQAGVQSIQTGVWKREIRVTQLYVVVGRDGTYENWHEEARNDTDYVSATKEAMIESSQLTDVSNPGWTIGRVRVAIVAKTNITTDEKVQPFLIVGGSTTFAGSTSLTTSYLTYTADWGINPSSNAPWEWADITNLQAGVQSVQIGNEWTGEIRVTQLYVEIAGPRFTVYIKVENVANLYGYNIQLKYTTAVTTATAIIFDTTFLPPYPYTKYTEVNDAAGYASFSASSDIGPVTGSGTLARIIFLIDSTGATTLDLDVKEFYDNSPQEIHLILGDLDGDRDVDTPDLSGLSNAYGSKLGDANWNSKCDFNTDSKVDVSDLFDQSQNYGKTIVYDGYFSNTYP